MSNLTPSIYSANIIAVVNIPQAEHAVPIAKALLAGGVQHIEVTLRHHSALKVIEAIAQNVPEMQVGAGTVISAQQFKDAVSAGAQYIFSPGFDRELVQFAIDQTTPYIPAISNASEAQLAVSLGYTHVKLFPAEVLGGTRLLKALHGPFPNLNFCPTGGITANNMTEYLQLPYVFAVGGSWLVSADIMQRQAWSEITTLCQSANSQ